LGNLLPTFLPSWVIVLPVQNGHKKMSQIIQTFNQMSIRTPPKRNSYTGVKKAKYEYKPKGYDYVKSGNQRTKKPRASTIVQVPRGFAMPPKLQNTMRYFDEVTLTTDINGFGKYLFSCNSLFDPDVSGVGVQPSYFEQLCARYDHYTVISSYATFTLLSASNTPHMTTLFINDSNTPNLATYQDAAMRPGNKTVTGVPSVALLTPLTMGWSAAGTFGGDPLSDSTLQGNATSSPSEQSYWVFCVNGAVSTSYTISCRAFYTTVWDELYPVNKS
jgi:hypothetical protein